MKVLLCSRSGDMFFGINHLYRLPPDSIIYHTEYHTYFKEVVEYLSPGRFQWVEVKETDHFDFIEHDIPSHGIYEVPVYKNTLPSDVLPLNMSKRMLSLRKKVANAFNDLYGRTGPVLIFPSARGDRKDIPLDFIESLTWPAGTILCVEDNHKDVYANNFMPLMSKTLPEYVALNPRAVVGACSLPVLFFAWLGIPSLKIHFHPISFPPRASIDHLGGQELCHHEFAKIQDWIDRHS